MRARGRPKTPPPEATPQDPRYLLVGGVVYYVSWPHMRTGHSVFLKTLAQARTVQRALRPVEDHYQITLVARQRCEFGYYGVRVWRMA